jgi:hypothetical protein
MGQGSAVSEHADILDAYVREAPSGANAMRIFAGEWSSRLPEPYAAESGVAPLFDDFRIRWALERLGSIAGFDVLELGPLEGAHTFMVEAAGAASVTAVEGNTRAFLKCLIVKELLGLTRSRFLLGDITEFLRADTSSYDLILASGVLYHLLEPMEALELIAGHTSRLLLWTHYFDEDVISADETARAKFSGSEERTTRDGLRYVAHRMEYGTALTWQGFCGGANDHSYLLGRDDILANLERLGFTNIEIGYEAREANPFPSITILAQKA